MFELHINATFIFNSFQGIALKRIHNFSPPQMQNRPGKVRKGRLRICVVFSQTKYFKLQLLVLELICKGGHFIGTLKKT